MGSTVVALIGGVGVILTAFATMWVTARKLGGTVKSSEAVDLWKESTAIREWSRARIESLEKELERCAEGRAQDRERIAVLEAKIAQMEGQDDPPGHLA